MSKISNEQKAHDLAVAVVTAQLSQSNQPATADVSVINAYDSAYHKLLSLVERLSD